MSCLGSRRAWYCNGPRWAWYWNDVTRRTSVGWFCHEEACPWDQNGVLYRDQGMLQWAANLFWLSHAVVSLGGRMIRAAESEYRDAFLAAVELKHLFLAISLLFVAWIDWWMQVYNMIGFKMVAISVIFLVILKGRAAVDFLLKFLAW